MRKELGTVLLGQLCAEGIDGDDEGAAVCFKLWGQSTGKETGREAVAGQLAGLPLGLFPRGPAGGREGAHLQDGAHGVGRGPAQQGAELVEGLQVGLHRAWGLFSPSRETRGGGGTHTPQASYS